MEFQKFLDPFGVERAARDQESQITAREARTSMDLLTMQQAMDQRRNRMAFLQEIAQEGQQPKALPGQPPTQQAPQQPSASDMILGELSQIDKRISSAAKYGLLDEQDKFLKLREQAMGRYSIAKDREEQGQQRIERQRKEAVASVSRFASGANAVLMDDTIPADGKGQALKDMEDSIREENPQAYKILARGKPTIDWADPRTWNYMKAVEQQAIAPEKRVELAISKQRADEQANRDETYARRVDAMIAASREGGSRERLPVGKQWVDPRDHSQGMQDIPDRSKKAEAIPADVHGQAYLEALPEGDREMVRGIAEGRIDPKTLSTKGGHREAILKQVSQYKPDYNQAKYSVYAAVQKDFTSGVAARNVTAINTAIHHMGTMDALGEALKNHDTQGINRITNAVANQFGDPRINDYKIASAAVANELMRVFRQVGASEAETKDWAAKFSDAQSPAQIREGIQTGAKLLRGRIEAVDEQWKRGMDSKEGFPDLLSPKSQGVLQKIGVKVRDEKPIGKPGKGGAMSLDDYVRAQEAKAQGGQ